MPLKVMTIVGTRPELIKLSRVIAELDAQMRQVLVHTGQNFDYELNEVFFEELAIRRPDAYLGAAGENAAQTIAAIIARVDEVLAKEQPDAVLLYGDTNSCLSVIAAKRRRIPVFHMEAGNRCFDERVPEEINRRLVDHLSDINMPLTEHARRYLLAEGIPADRIIKTGSTMFEVLEHYRPAIEASTVLSKLGLEPRKYLLASAHREENVDDPARLAQLLESFKGAADEFAMPLVVSTHPRTRKRLEEAGLSADPRIRFLKPFGLPDYVRLQVEAFCVLSDSGTLSEEASLLGFAAVMLREAHERPEGIEHGAVVMAGLGRQRVLEAVSLAVAQRRSDSRPLEPIADYRAPAVSKKVARIILGYTDYVNRRVWHKQP